MRVLALLTIALPVALVPFQVRPENAFGAPAAGSETTAVVASTNPLWDERLDSPRFLNPGAAERTFLSRASVSITGESAIESAEPAPDGLDLARNLNSLEVAAWERGDLVKAGEYHRQALEIRQKLAPGSLVLAESYN